MDRSKMDNLYKLLFLKNKPLSTQLFFLSALLIIIPMIGVGFMSYHWSSSIMEDQALGYNLEVLSQVQSHVEYYMRDFSRQAIKILNNPEMLFFLWQIEDGKFVDTAKLSAAQKVLSEAMLLTPEIYNISLRLDNIGTIYAVDRYDATGFDVSQEYWYPLVPKRDGYPILVSRFVTVQGRPEPVISLIKRVASPKTMEPIGILMIDINFRRLQEIAHKFNVSDRSFYIVDYEGRYVYHPERTMIGTNADNSLLGAIRLAQPDKLFTMDDKQQYLIISQSPQLNWRFLVTIPYSEIQREILQLGKVISITVIITLFAAYLLGLAYLTTIIRPLRNLQKTMKEVEIGRLTGAVRIDSEDEIGQLSRGFNKMVGRLSELVDEVYLSRVREAEAKLGQKELEIKVLQAQINPHFIGNSLETIRGMAMEEELDNIAAIAGSLSLLLRYNLRKGTSIVLLSEEVKFLEMYYKVQCYRFGDIVKCEINLPDWALEQQIVKFCLQPLVENCFMHGINRKLKRLTIILSAERDTDASFLVHITDTGNGIDEERLKRIRADLQADEANYSQHIGLMNVHRRIVHLFGKDYGIRIHSLLGGGTRVTIRLPFKNDEGE